MSESLRIVRIEMGRLGGVRPRHAGSNARLGAHGLSVRPPVMRVTASDGTTGFGLSHISRDRAEAFLGTSLGDVFTADEPGIAAGFAALDQPLWDWAGKRAGLPVYALLGTGGAAEEPLRARCYDTSLYFDDLDIPDDDRAAVLIASEARDGWARGHRAFKIKVGRGARHMALEAGTRRDIAIIRAVREAVGPDAPLMVDANNGYNLNLTKRVLDETADCGIYWLEEAFHEDAVLYRDLKEWMTGRGLSVLIADGEGEASPSLLAWARDGLIDVIQYDVFGYGFSRWLALGRELAGSAVRLAPHHYGAHLGNYVTGHLARALPRFEFVEWDEVTSDTIKAPGYVVSGGMVTIPDAPGFGLTLDESAYADAVKRNGFSVNF